MARREVTDEDVKREEFPPFLNFFEIFTKVGDQFVGVYKASRKSPAADYYDFKQRDGSVGTLSVKGPLKAQLAKADPREGEKVTISVKGKRDAYFVFTVVVDDPPKRGAAPPPKQEESDDPTTW